MHKKTCTCSTKNLNPAEHFLARGKVHIFLVLDLSNFITNKSQKDFDRLRGGQAFSNAIKNVEPQTPFDHDHEENETIKRGHAFSVFRGHLVQDWLFPTFSLNKAKTTSPSEANLKQAWDKYEFRIRLSRAGFLEIKLTRPVPTPPHAEERLIDLLRDLLQVSSRDSTINPVQWRLGLHGANQFIATLPPSISVEEANQKVEIGLQTLALDTPELPQRLRYTTLFLDTIQCKHCGKRIEAQQFWKRDKKTLSAVLEGALIRLQDGQFTFPELDDGALEKLEDLATWKNELCIFAPERSLIYYPPEYIFLPGQENFIGPVKYEEYWKCILRGIEHTISVRAALQILEGHTTRELDKVPHLTKKMTDGDISPEDERDIMHMADEMANTFNILPSVRDVLVPTSVFRASFAVNKFLHLNATLHLKDVLMHVERNVDELVIFLNHFTDVRLQAQLQRNEVAISIAGIIIATVAFFVAGPSSLQDFHEFFGTAFNWPKGISFALFLIMGHILAIAIVVISYRYLYRPYQHIKILIKHPHKYPEK